MQPEANDRELLRQTFNTAAAQYQEARPEYPGELYAALIALAGLRPEADTLCEVGAGPGKATIPLAILENEDGIEGRERALFETHPLAGYVALKRTPGISPELLDSLMQRNGG